MNKIYIIFILIFLTSLFGCKKDILEVDYNNQHDVPSGGNIDSEEIEALGSSLFWKWYMNQTTSLSPRMAIWTMSDQGTSSWANRGMRDLSSEPRAEFNNTEEYTYADNFLTYYNDSYVVLSTANNILKSIKNGTDMGDDTEKYRALSSFLQGVSLGYLGLVYDKSFIVTENTDEEVLMSLEAAPYSQVVDSALVALDKCIDICNSSSFTIGNDWISGDTYSNNELARLANSYAARILVAKARTTQENTATDWSKVLNYSNNGISKDFKVFNDNINWKNWFFHYTVSRENWARIDARIINMIDPSYPYRYPDLSGEPAPGEATSADARLLTDFNYDPVCEFLPERGYYHYSNYEYNVRYTYTQSNPEYTYNYLGTENDLLKAEALFHTGDKSGAISILNSGTRVNRGALAELDGGISDTEFLEALFYERDIELIMTGFGLAYFDMRRRDMLQEGTMLHFPIPAEQLNVMGMPTYTFGGVANADGINTSNGGWFPAK